MFQIPFVINDDDYLEFIRYHLYHTASGRKLLTRVRLTAPTLGIFALFLFVLAGARPLLLVTEALVITLLSLALLPLSARITLFSTRRQLARMRKAGRLPYAPEGELLFEEDVLREITPGSETCISYSRIEQIGVTSEAVYLCSGMAQAYILPFSSLPDGIKKEQLLAFVRQKTGLQFS